MKIAVLNGSPKGGMSVTMQYVAYLGKKLPALDFEIYNVGKRIKGLERDREQFDAIIRGIGDSDAVLWAFGVYMEMVPYPLKRFIELIFERKAADVFEGKYTASLSTSARWLDNLAHDYVQAITDDLGMQFCGFHSAETEELEKEEEQKRLVLFGEKFMQSIQSQSPYFRRFPPISSSSFEYCPDSPGERVSLDGKKAVVISDCRQSDTNLRRMIDRFKGSFFEEIPEINLHEIDIKGGCTACFRCAYDNRCRYEEIDDYNRILRDEILTADILILAGSVRDRYLSSRWKLFLDRNFVYGHIPIYRNKQVGVIVSGPLNQVSTLRTPIEQGQDWHRSHLIDFVSDDCNDSQLLSALLEKLAQDSVQFSKSQYIKTPTFAYVGVSKLIRDELWRYQRSIMKADNRHYRRHGLYDFPKMGLMHRAMGIMYSMAWFRKKLHQNKNIDKLLMESQQKVVEQTKQEIYVT